MTDPENEAYNSNHYNDFQEKEKVSQKLKFCMYMLFTLVFLRICALQFIMIFSDLLTSLMVYCTYSSKGKLMAIFCGVSGLMGIIYEVTLVPNDLKRISNLSTEKHTKKTHNIYSNGMTSKNNFNMSYYDQNDYNNENVNTGENYDFNSYNESKNSQVSYIYTLMIINMIFAIIIYTCITYFSYKAYYAYENLFGEIPLGEGNANLNNGGGGGYNNYGGTDSNGLRVANRNNNVYGYSDGENNSNNRFVPFSGRGQAIGGNE